MAIKNVGTKDQVMEARFIIEGHKGKEKGTLIHNSPNLRHRSARFVLSVVELIKFKEWTQDVSQAYIHPESEYDPRCIRQAISNIWFRQSEVLKLINHCTVSRMRETTGQRILVQMSLAQEQKIWAWK